MQPDVVSWRSVLILLPVWVLSSSAFTPSEVICNESKQSYCAALNKGVKTYFGNKSDIHSYVLVWNSQYEHAAAAMVRANLITTGYNVNSVLLHDAKDELVISNNTVVLNVSLGHLVMHMRLSARAAAYPECKNVYQWLLIRFKEVVQKCDILTTRKNQSDKIVIYLPAEINEEILKEITILDNTIFIDLHEIIIAHRSHISHLLQESSNSLFVIDTDRWKYTKNGHVQKRAFQEKLVIVYCEPNLSPGEQNLNSSVLPPSLHAVQKRTLRWVVKTSSLLSKEEVACIQELVHFHSDTSYDQFQTINPQKHQTNVVLLVTSKAEQHDIERLSPKLFSFLGNISFIASHQSIYSLQPTLIMNGKECYDVVGVILANEMVIDVLRHMDNGKDLVVPLITYDIATANKKKLKSHDVYPATGSLINFVESLMHLLAKCNWQRLAIVTEKKRFSAALSEELKNRINLGGVHHLSIYNITAKSHSRSEYEYVLEKLLEKNARVILLNTDAITAAGMLAQARMLNMTWKMGFVWIVRDYDLSDIATAAVEPLSVSFQWRGAEDEKEEVPVNGENAKLRRQLEELWKGRAWPQHSASIVDAFLTLAAGLQRLNTKYNLSSIPFYQWNDDIKRKFWSVVEEDKIPGLVQDLEYHNKSLTSPFVFVHQWGAGPRPRLLASWRVGEGPAECPVADAPPDGSVRCLAPAGDPFLPECRDYVWISAVIGTIVATGLVVAAVWWSRRAIKARDKRVKADFAMRLLARRERVFAALATHLVERSSLDLHEELGKGRFGRVWIGMLRSDGRERRTGVVAVKALREDAASVEESEFLREACTLAELEHEHIVRFVGVCVVDGPPLLIMEYAFFGDLLRYLQSRRYLALRTPAEQRAEPAGIEEQSQVSAEALTKLAREAAEALTYLARCKLVHRDVRAANCLVDERRSLKLADFGLARATGTVDGEYACRRRGLFPVAWMAPESLAGGVFSAPSDVWALGVLVFELVTLGRRPYGALPPPAVLQLVAGGGRPRLPWDASAETRALARACWRREPEARPAAAQVASWLARRRCALRPALAEEYVGLDALPAAAGDGLDELTPGE